MNRDQQRIAAVQKKLAPLIDVGSTKEITSVAAKALLDNVDYLLGAAWRQAGDGRLGDYGGRRRDH